MGWRAKLAGTEAWAKVGRRKAQGKLGRKEASVYLGLVVCQAAVLGTEVCDLFILSI